MKRKQEGRSGTPISPSGLKTSPNAATSEVRTVAAHIDTAFDTLLSGRRVRELLDLQEIATFSCRPWFVVKRSFTRMPSCFPLLSYVRWVSIARCAQCLCLSSRGAPPSNAPAVSTLCSRAALSRLAIHRPSWSKPVILCPRLCVCNQQSRCKQAMRQGPNRQCLRRVQAAVTFGM